MWKRDMKRGAMIVVIAAITTNFTASEETPATEQVLAIQLMPNWSGPVTFGVATRLQGKIVHLRHITMREFIMIGTGAVRHPANHNGQNIFSENGVQQCTTFYDSLDHKHFSDCRVVENLWRLRYKKLPNESEGKETGLARHNSAPDEAQLGLLKQFGITRLNDFIYDDQVFRLLKASADPQWVQSYR